MHGVACRSRSQPPASNLLAAPSGPMRRGRSHTKRSGGRWDVPTKSANRRLRQPSRQPLATESPRQAAWASSWAGRLLRRMAATACRRSLAGRRRRAPPPALPSCSGTCPVWRAASLRRSRRCMTLRTLSRLGCWSERWRRERRCSRQRNGGSRAQTPPCPAKADFLMSDESEK